VRTLQLPLPAYLTSGAAGMDILAAAVDDVRLEPDMVVTIPTGLAIAIPVGWEAQIGPRSGLAVHNRITLPNAPVTIDSDYRGEILVPPINLGESSFIVTIGMPIAQLVFARVSLVSWVEVPELPPPDPGGFGFGHTGV
jgi:dUTP pyrophosphatase